MSVRDFAEHLGVAIRTISKWEARGETIALRPATEELLDIVLERAAENEVTRFRQLVNDHLAGHALPGSQPVDSLAQVLLPLVVDGRPVLAPVALDAAGNRAIVSLDVAIGAVDVEGIRDGYSSGSEMDIARRQALGVFAYGLAATAWGMAPSGRTVAHPGRRLPSGVIEPIRDAVLGYDQVLAERAHTAAATDLHASVSRAQRRYQGVDYAAVARMIPAMITAADVGGSMTPKAQVLRSSTYVVAAKLLTKVGEAELAWLCADRAAAAANLAESASAKGAATYQIVCAMLAAGAPDHAEQLAIQAAEGLGAAHPADEPELLSHTGALWLISAVIAARRGDQAAATQRLGRADDLATTLGRNANFGWTAFGPANVAIHRLSAAKDIGDPRAVLRLADTVDVDALPSGLQGRRAEAHVNLAWAHARLRNDAEAEYHLSRIDAVAPELLRYNHVSAAVVRDLLNREHRGRTPALRQLAQRAGLT